jgi:transaldolase
MKIFLDTASITDIKQWLPFGLIDGITTNPTHLSKEGQNPHDIIKEICALLKYGEVSVQITEKSPELVYKQAKVIAALANNVVVKIPCYKEYYPIIKKLVDEGIKINITLLFSLVQALFMCKLGVTYISPFIGRWDDIDIEGSDLLFELREMIDRYQYDTQILAASLRSVRHMHTAIMAGADIITVPVKVLQKATEHVLTDKGMELFARDWEKLGIKQFP